MGCRGANLHSVTSPGPLTQLRCCRRKTKRHTCLQHLLPILIPPVTWLTWHLRTIFKSKHLQLHWREQETQCFLGFLHGLVGRRPRGISLLLLHNADYPSKIWVNPEYLFLLRIPLKYSQQLLPIHSIMHKPCVNLKGGVVVVVVVVIAIDTVVGCCC